MIKNTILGLMTAILLVFLTVSCSSPHHRSRYRHQVPQHKPAPDRGEKSRSRHNYKPVSAPSSKKRSGRGAEKAASPTPSGAAKRSPAMSKPVRVQKTPKNLDFISGKRERNR